MLDHRAVLDAALASVGRGGLVELVRLGSSAVYRVDADLLAKVTPGDAAVPTRALSVARLLTAADVPSVTPHPELPDPVPGDGATVSWWRWLDHDPDRPATPAECGALLRRLHAVRVPPQLPPAAPLDGARRRLARLEASGDPTARALAERVERAHRAWQAVDADVVVLHCDFNAGNILRTSAGLVLTDFDDTGAGPWLWDLVPLLRTPGREAFLAAYGRAELDQAHLAALTEVWKVGHLVWERARLLLHRT